jgi:exosortase
MKLQKQLFVDLAHQALKTTHNRITACGLFIGLCYFPAWLGCSIWWAIYGTADLFIVLAFAFLGIYRLWSRRHQLKRMRAPAEDRLIGHILILSGVILFPFCRFAIWSQATIWVLILLGIALSSWGIPFFTRYPLSSLLILISAHPTPGVLSGMIVRATTPPRLLDTFMAHLGAYALQAIGLPAVSQHAIISLPEGGVEVEWGCNGFEMALTMAAASLILGLWLNLSRAKIALLIGIGIVLALLFNVPRIMLLTLASVYWGEESFKFWHGPLGGQLFSTVLFTVYYYAVMGIINRRPPKRSLH